LTSSSSSSSSQDHVSLIHFHEPILIILAREKPRKAYIHSFDILDQGNLPKHAESRTIRWRKRAVTTPGQYRYPALKN